MGRSVVARPAARRRSSGCSSTERPDLLLLPSPLELTGDHRAAFAALHRVLTGLRAGDALFDVTAELRVLAYEVNHAAHPDLLVDVSRERAAIESAMSHYRSQLERHGYLEAALGLRRWRCLTLGPQVELAEGYRSLRAADFRTRTLAQLTTELGGVPDARPGAAKARWSRSWCGPRTARRCSPKRSAASPPAPTAGSRWCWSTTAALSRRRPTASRCRWCASTSTPTGAGPRRPTPASPRRAATTCSSSTTTI